MFWPAWKQIPGSCYPRGRQVVRNIQDRSGRIKKQESNIRDPAGLIEHSFLGHILSRTSALRVLLTLTQRVDAKACEYVQSPGEVSLRRLS